MRQFASRLRAVNIYLMTPLLGVAVFVAVFVSALAPAAKAATTSSNLNFQARLLTNTGSVVPDGNYNIDFKIYTADSTTGSVGTCSGSCVWEETRKNSNSQGVQVINGYFSVNLGSVTAFGSINWDQQLWLTMNIGGTTTGASPTWDGEMQNAGRSIALTALPYSFTAGQLAATSGANRGTLSFGSVTNNPVITLPNASGTVCLNNSAACGFIQGSGTAFVQGGNTGLGATAVLGTTDSQSLNFITNNHTIQSISTTGATTFENFSDSNTAFQVQNASASAMFNINTADGYVINNGVGNLGNNLENPSFESSGSTDATGWYTPSASQVITNSSANAHSGNYELQVTGNSSTHAVTTKYYAVHPGDTVYVEGWVKNSGGANGDAGLYLEFSDKDKGNSTFTNSDTGLPGTSYILKSFTTTVPSGKYFMRIAASVKATATTGTFYFDDFYLKLVNEKAPLLITNSSSTAFQVQNSSSQTVLGVDASANKIFTTIPDSGTAIGFTFNTPSYTTAGAKLLSLQNNSAEKFTVDKDGNIVNTGNITASGNISAGSGKQFQINGTQISSADLSNNSNLAKLNGTGPQVFSGNNEFDGTVLNKVASATAFQVQNASNAVFTVDTSGNKVILGTASNITGKIQFQGSGGAGTLTLTGPTTPDSGNYTLTIPTITANANICTDNSICSGYASSSSLTSGLAGKLNKGSVDTSAAAVTAVQGDLYAFTNSSSGIASGVLKLDNGNNTDNALYITGSTDYASGKAYIVVNNTNGTPTGSLIDLQSNAASQFSVDASGNVTAAGNISIASGKQYQINGVQISTSALSDGGTLAKLGANQTFTGNNTFSSASNSFTGDGSGLSNLNASNVASGTLNDGRLSSNVALLNRTGQSFTGDNSFAPTANNAGTTIKQTSGTATSGSVLDVQTANGSSSFLKITNAAANEGNVTLQSVGATRDLTLGSGSGNLIITAATNTITHSNSGLTIDINNGADSTLTITNGQSGVVANLSVEGDIAVGASRVYKVGATSGTSTTCSSNTFSQNQVVNGGITTSVSCANAVTSISASGGSIANGASISGNALTLGYADTSNPGLVSNTTQSFNGNKTFTGNTAIQNTSTTAFQVQSAGGGSTFFTVDTSGKTVTVNAGTVYATNTYSSGSSGTITQSVIDNNTTVLASATASGLTFTVPSPTGGIAGRLLYLSNNGSNSFIVSYGTGSFSLSVNSTVALVYNGAAWSAAGADAGTLQTDYNNATNGTSPDIKLDSTRLGIDIQDADSALNATLLAVRNSNSSGLGASIFDVQSANPITDITNNATNNLVTNGSFETGTTGWIKMGSTQVAVAQDNNSPYIGSNSLKVVTNATDTSATDGAKYNLTTSTLTSNTKYSLTLSARAVAGTSMTSTFEIGYRNDNTAGSDTSCLASQTVLGTGWTNFSCTFTTSTTANTPYIYAKINNQSANTYYIDAVSLTRVSLLSNASVEQALTSNDWVKKGNASDAVSQISSQSQDGSNSLQVITTSNASPGGDGTKHNITLNDSAQYNLSFYAKANGSNFSVLEAGYSSDGSTDNTICITAQTVVTTGWTAYSCNFVTPSSHSGTPFFYVKQTDTSGRTFYLDNFQLSIGNSISAYREGTISLNGVITSPVVLQAQTNSTTAFQVQAANGANILVVDSVNRQLKVMENNGTTNYALIYYDTSTSTANYTASSGTVAVGTGAGAITVTAGSGGAVNITGNAASTWKTNTGTLTLQSGTSSDLILNPGSSIVSVNGSSVVKLGSSAGDPGTCTTGGIVYNSTTNLFRGCQSGSWATLSSTTQTLQNGYTASTGGTTPEIKVDATRGGVDIQDADTSIAGVLFGVRMTNAGGLGTILFDVNSSSNAVHIGSASTHSSNAVILVLDNYGNAGADPTGTNGAIYYNSTKNIFRCYVNSAWQDCMDSARTSYHYINDFLTPSNGAQPGSYTSGDTLFNSFNTAAGWSAGTAVAGRPGILNLTTGSTAAGQAGVFGGSGNTGIVLGNSDIWSFESAVNLPTLSTSAQRYVVRSGFVDDNAGDGTDGCFFRYSDNLNSGKWTGVCRNNSTESTCDTGITVSAATWYRLDVVVNGAGNSVDFRTGGTSRCQVTTNIPTTSARETAFGTNIIKTVGTTTSTLTVDYMEVRGDLATAR